LACFVPASDKDGVGTDERQQADDNEHHRHHHLDDAKAAREAGSNSTQGMAHGAKLRAAVVRIPIV
jgi:hypothetical protein